MGPKLWRQDGFETPRNLPLQHSDANLEAGTSLAVIWRKIGLSAALPYVNLLTSVYSFRTGLFTLTASRLPQQGGKSSELRVPTGSWPQRIIRPVFVYISAGVSGSPCFIALCRSFCSCCGSGCHTSMVNIHLCSFASLRSLWARHQTSNLLGQSRPQLWKLTGANSN